MTLREENIDDDTQFAIRQYHDGQLYGTIFVDNVNERMTKLNDLTITLQWPTLLRLAKTVMQIEEEFNFDHTSYRDTDEEVGE